MSRRGSGLEVALARAGRWYRTSRGTRVVLVRQFPDVATDGQGGAFYSSGAPVDFLGALEGKPLALEAKESRSPSMAMSRLREDQRTLMGLLHAAGGDVRLVLDFAQLGEVYAVAWPELASFIAAPWRASFSLAWCRAHGLLLPQDDADDTARRKVLFLDGESHPERAEAIAQCETERACSRWQPEPAQLDDDAETAPEPHPLTGMTPEQVRERVREAVLDGVDRQLRRPRMALPERRR